MSTSLTDNYSSASSFDYEDVEVIEVLESSLEEQSEKTPLLCVLSQGTDGCSASSSSPNVSNLEVCNSSLPTTSTENITNVAKSELSVWKQPTNGYSKEELLCLLEKEHYESSLAQISLLTRLTLQAPPPPRVADELLQVVKNLEMSLSVTAATIIKGGALKLHPAKSISEVDLSQTSFIKFIKSRVGEKSQLSEDYMCILREMIFSEARIFENKLIKIINDGENFDFITSTKQSLLSNAAEEKSISVFKENLDKVKSKFISLLTCNYELRISECERAEILVHMIMCYAKIVERVIFKEKAKCLGTNFVKFGHIHITKIMSSKLQSLVEELPRIASTALTKNHSIITKEAATKGCLSELFIRKIIIDCARSKRLNDLENKAKEEVSGLAHKIIINDDQLILGSNAIFMYAMSVFVYNLAESLEDYVKLRISQIIYKKEKYSSSSRKRSHTLPWHHHSERSKKSNRDLFSYLAQGCKNIETPNSSSISALTQLQLMSESPPITSTELFESIRKIEIYLPCISDIHAPNTTELALKKIEYSARYFMRVIKYLLGKKSCIENAEICKLRKEVTSSVREFEQTFLKIADNEEEAYSLIIKETKQCYLANAIEKKLIDIFNSNLIEVKERFKFALQRLQEKSYGKSEVGLVKLILPEKNINSIIVHMLMRYASMLEKLIHNKKMLYSNLETFFSKVGQVYVTKRLHGSLEKVRGEFHKTITNDTIKRNAKLIEETVRSDGELSQLLINNIVGECISGNEQILKEKMKLALSQHCSKIALDNGQLIPSNPRVEEYLIDESFISLKGEIESIMVRSSTKYIETPTGTGIETGVLSQGTEECSTSRSMGDNREGEICDLSLPTISDKNTPNVRSLQGTEECSTSRSIGGNRTGEICNLSLPTISDKNTPNIAINNPETKLPVWKQPTNGCSKEDLLSLLEKEYYKNFPTTSSKISLLTRLTLQAPLPPRVANELLQIVKNIEMSLSSLLSVSMPEVKVAQMHLVKSIDDLDCSREGFTKLIQSCISEESSISEYHIYLIRYVVISEAAIFRNKSMKAAVTTDNENFIVSTKQSSLSYAVEEKLIHMFKENIEDIKSTFISSIPCKSSLTVKPYGGVNISEIDRIAILIQMLMYYAKLVKEIIFEEKVSYLSGLFVRFGHIHITRTMSNKLHYIIEEKLPELAPLILARKQPLIGEEIAKKGYLTSSFVRNIAISSAESKEIKILRRISKDIISESCHKIVINNDQLIPKSNVILEYIESVFNYNLVKSLEGFIMSNICESVKIPYRQNNPHESSKESKYELFLYLTQGYENVEANDDPSMPFIHKLQSMAESTPRAYAELHESIIEIEMELSTNQEHTATGPSQEKSASKLKCHAKDFIPAIKSLLSEEFPVKNLEMDRLRKEIKAAVRDFKVVFLKIADSEEEVDKVIRETKQSYLANAIERKLIDIFKSNIVLIKERFGIALQESQRRQYNESTTRLQPTLPEKNRNSIIIYMLMFYAKTLVKLIRSKRIIFSSLEVLFSKVGQIYITKHLRSHLNRVKAEFHEVAYDIIKSKAMIIKDSIRATGNLGSSLINSIVSECVKGNNYSLEEKLKLVLSKHCSKIALDDGQLIALNPRIEEYLIKELFVSLKEEIESRIIQSSMKYIEASYEYTY
ncbi:hypothetical protein [Candidatus Ichthyocystis hellenicum]|uniref:hypothetical protein n=1 Tax=Candidatus Ichthyocystis hellenicum TaxID=1561003 RepID=UPI000B84DDB1|nr:hypothetical protein [Candidatus Ichthyocystis hellenicum]